MCESLPLGQPLPRRYGNEQLCPPCQAGDCEHCTVRHNQHAWCEHPCRWLPTVLTVPNPRKANR